MHLDSMKGRPFGDVFTCETVNLGQLRHLNLVVTLTDATVPFVSSYHFNNLLWTSSEAHFHRIFDKQYFLF